MATQNPVVARKRATAIQVALFILIPGIFLSTIFLPLGAYFYIASIAISITWANANIAIMETERLQSLTRYINETKKPLWKIWTIHPGFGCPGESEGENASRWPPTRISSWWSLIIAVLVTFIPGQHFRYLNLFFVYFLCQVFSYARRHSIADGDVAPAAMFKFFKHGWRSIDFSFKDFVISIFHKIIGLLHRKKNNKKEEDNNDNEDYDKEDYDDDDDDDYDDEDYIDEDYDDDNEDEEDDLLVASETQPYILNTIKKQGAHAILAGIISGVAVGGILTSLSLLTHSWKTSTGSGFINRISNGLSLMFSISRFNAELYGVFFGVLGFLGAISYYYSKEFRVTWKTEVENRNKWNGIWSVLPKIKSLAPPTYIMELGKPDGALEPDIVDAVFQIPDGGNFELYAKAELAPSLETDKFFIDRMQHPNYRNIAFVVSYAKTEIPNSAHLRVNIEPHIQEFAIKKTFIEAFDALKLGRPELKLPIINLATEQSRGVLLETRWVLPPHITFDAVVKSTKAIEEKIGASYLRIGRRTIGSGRNSTPVSYISIIYGDKPTNIELKDEKTRDLLDAFVWDARFRICNVKNSEGITPLLKQIYESEGQKGLIVNEFYACDGIPFEVIQRSQTAMVPTTGKKYVSIEPTDDADNAGGFKIILGDEDPLDDIYLFMDYTDILLVKPKKQPDISFYVGIGADGDALRFSNTAENPHIIPLALDTIVPKTNGTFTTIGEIQVGDEVFNHEGQSVKVRKVHDIHIPERCFKLYFDNGEVVEASGTHRWLTEKLVNGCLDNPQIVSTLDIYNDQPVQHAVISLDIKENILQAKRYSYIVKCVEIQAKPMRCIEVASNEHMFLITKSYIGTHNCGGTTGQGKSIFVHSAIVQLVHKNTPTQLNLRIVEPKSELQRYKTLPHVTHFLDNFDPLMDENRWEAVGIFTQSLVDEMRKRNKMFPSLPGSPTNIQEARSVKGFPVDEYPYIVCIFEECAEYLAKDAAITKEQQVASKWVMANIDSLARLARSAGIYLIFATQRPTKQAIPTGIKGQCSRVGFGVTDLASSMVIIDQPGLENIKSPGRGLMFVEKKHRGFRSFLLQKPSESNPNQQDEIALALTNIPKLNEDRFLPLVNLSLNELNASLEQAPIPDDLWDDD